MASGSGVRRVKIHAKSSGEAHSDVEGKFTLRVTPAGRTGRAGEARIFSTKLAVRVAYVRAARVSVDVGSEVRVVNDTWEVESPEKAVDGRPSSAASHAAPLPA